MKIAFQGARGAFSHRATQLFSQQLGNPSELEPLPCMSFDDVFDQVASGACDFAAIPLENSSVGTIVANYDLLQRSPVFIVSEVFVDVHHNLLGIDSCKLEDVREVYSHPVALDQCRKFLSSLPKARAVAYWDTSGAAFHVKEQQRSDLAAIAGDLAAQETGLTVVQSKVEDFAGNRTRFGIITKESASNGSNHLRDRSLALFASKSQYKITCAIELTHEAGTLARLLNALANSSANLTKIESRPIPETPWHYRFFLDMQIHQSVDETVVKNLAQLTINSKVLGRYPVWEKQS